MRTSLNWLKQYVDFSASPEDLAHRLTMAGLEVENFEDLGKKYKNFVVGRVLEVEKHPSADKLSLCKVNVRENVLQIVCGAPNVATGQKVIVGLVGAIVPHNQHDPEGKPFILSQVRIRGIESFGMICSAHEMGLGEDKSGIFVLPVDAPVGTPLGEYLQTDDVVFEIGVTPNRPDALSHIGIAREIAALYDKPLKFPEFTLTEGKTPIEKHASVEIHDTEDCPRYTARIIFDVKVGESPIWLQAQLKAVGLRPINNVVDITNYVLMEIGQPIHAFDYDKLDGHAIHVRRAHAGESFTTLDHKERILRNDTLMICDVKGSVAIAGVMGGMNSEISGSTKNVLIESAYFSPKSIRKTSKNLGLSTDASQRFERGCDPNITEWAANRVAALIQQLCGGQLISGTLDVYPKKIHPHDIPLRINKTNQVLGTTLDSQSISALLRKIDIREKDSDSKAELLFAVPTFRPDIDREIDLIEEVARLYGYDNIETKLRSTICLPETIVQKPIVDLMRDWLIGRGYYEVVSNSMQPKTLATIDSEEFVEIANPVSQDMAVLRTSLIPNALQIVKNNIYHGTLNIRFFEIGKAYFKETTPIEKRPVPGYREEERVVLVISGTSNRQTWNDGTPRKADIYDIKGELEVLCEKISLDKFKFIPYTTSNALTEIGLTIEIYGKNRGFLGKIRKDILKQFDIEQDVFVAEISLEGILFGDQSVKKFKPLPEYPSVLRDIALITDDTLPVGELFQALHEAGGSLLKNIELFDIYQGNQIQSGKKSSAFALEFQSIEKTLSQNEIDGIMNTIIRHVSLKFNASLRM